ncbi:MAG: TfoX/Sxy family protein [Methylotenera sp.]|nr:TfoX/Sxy family protein [Methylotenera sp.]
MPPKPQNEFVAFVIEQMSFVHGLRVRAMFSGHGVYQDDCMFAIIVDEQLFFKADANVRTEFEAKDLKPYTYVTRGKLVAMQYFEAPPEVFDEIDEMRIWVNKALTVARRARKNKGLPFK